MRYFTRLLLVAALCVPWAMRAQEPTVTFQSYGFETGIDATRWVELTTTTNLLLSTGDGVASTLQDIGFTFNFSGTDYTQFSVNADGNLRLGSTVTGNSAYTTPFSSSNANSNNPKINFLGCDGYITDSGHVYKELVEYSPGDTMLVVEFFTSTYNTNSRNALLRWQVHLYPNGNIEVVAGGTQPSIMPFVARQPGMAVDNSNVMVVDNTNNALFYNAGAPGTTFPAGTWYDSYRYFLFVHPDNITCPNPLNLVVTDITGSGATLSWTETGNATSWEVTVGDDTYTVTGTPSYTLSGLEGNTPYTWSVRSICGSSDQSYASYGAFRTACVAISSMPFTNDFENEPYYSATPYADAFPNCWTRINDATGTYNYYPYISNSASYAHSGSVGMYWYHTTTSTYSNNQYAVLPPVDLEAYDISDLTLSFYARTTGATYHPQPIVGVMDDPDSLDSFTPVYTFAADEITTDWELYTISLASYTGTGAYIAIKWPRPGSTSYLAIDDIILSDEWCDVPGDLIATSTTDEITISWRPNGGSSFTVYLNDDTIQGVTDTFYVFSNLDPNSHYDYGVYRECSSGNSLTITGSIRTKCLPITEMPYVNDFEQDPYYLSNVTPYADAFPYCWKRANDATGTYNYYPYLSNSSSYVHSGSVGMYWSHSSSTGYAQNEYAILPPVAPDQYNISDLTLSFYVKTTSASYHPQPVVGVLDDPDSLDSFTPVYTFAADEITTSWELASISFADYEGEGTYIAIKWANPGSTCYMAIDDIDLTDAWCDLPTDVAASSTTSEVTVSWEPGDGESFTVFLGEDTVTGIDDAYYTFYDLPANTAYTYGVATECSSSNSSFVTGTIRTLCEYLDTLPYVQDFEQEPTGGSTSTSFANCMTRLNNGTQYFGYPYISATASYNHTTDGTKGLYWSNSTTEGTYGDYQIVALPGVNPDYFAINTLQLRFWACATSTSYLPVFQVGVMTDPNDATTFELVSTVNVGGNTDYNEFIVPLNDYEGEGLFVAIRALRPTSAWYATVDDITLETMPNCPPVKDITATTTVSNALLTWSFQEGYEAPSTYELTYDVVGGSNPTTVQVYEPQYSLSNLLPGTAYKAYIFADCGSEGMGASDSIEFVTQTLGCLTLDPATADTIQIGEGAAASTAYYLPASTFFKYSYTQQLILASELNGAATLTGIDFQYNYSTPTTSKTDVTLYLANVTDSVLNTGFVAYSPAFVQVYSGDLNCSQGWNHFDFDVPFTYDGTSNLLVVAHDNSNAYNGSSYTFNTHAAANLARYVQNDNTPYDIHTVSGGTSYNYRVNMKFYAGECLVQATCAAPAVSVTDVAATSIDISWAPGADETSWDVSYRIKDDSTWTSAATGITAQSYSFTGLNDGTDYELRVSFFCADDNNTLYQTIVEASTVCAPKQMPYTQNFDSLTTGTATSSLTVYPQCWDYIMTGSSTYQGATYLPGVYYSANYANSGNYCLRLYGVGYFMLPEVAPTLDSVRITFTDTITSASYAGLVVGVMENGVFIPVDTADITTGVRNFVEVKFRGYTGNSHVIALQNYHTTSSTTYYSYHYIDDIVIDYIPACTHVDNLAVADLQDTSVTLTWTAGDEESSWLVYWGDNVVEVFDETVTLNGLTPDQTYEVGVRSFCDYGDTSEAWTITFRTPCSPQALPYTENFENYGTGASEPISSCWAKGAYYVASGAAYTTQYPYPNTTNAISGSRSLYFYSLHSSTATSSFHSYAALPAMAAPIDTLMVDFSLRRYSTTTASYTSYMVVGVMSDPNDLSTFVGVDTIDLHDEAPLSVHNFEVAFNGYNGNGKYIAFFAAEPPLYGTSTASYSYNYLDDIVVDYIPSCRRILDVVFDGSDESSASFHWVPTNATYYGYEVEYGPEGYTPGTGTLLSTTDTFITITGLNASTGYDFYVRTICNSNETAPWSFVTNFRTVCGIFNLPYMEDFERYGSGYSYGIDPCWTKGTNSTTAYPYPYSTNAITGQRSLYFYAYQPSSATSTPYYSYAALPEFTAGVDSLELSFKMRRYSTVSNYYTSLVVVGVMTDPADISTFVGVDTIDLHNEAASSVHDIMVTFENYTGTGNHIAFYAPVPPLYGSGSYTYNYAYIDDVNVNLVSPCGRPYGLTGAVASNSITLDWTDTIGATQWQIEYGPAGFQLGTGTTLNVTTHPYTITGLTPSTFYDVYVRSFCANGALGGTNSGIYSYSTSQVPATVPYFYDFENAAEWTNWQTVSNNIVNWYRGTAEAAEGSYGLYVSADSGATCNSFHSTITNAAVYRDIDFGPTPSSYEVTFRAKSAGVNDGNYEGINVMLVDPAAPVAASSSSLTSPWGQMSVVHVVRDTNWDTYTMLFDNISGVQRLAFNWYTSTTTSHPVWDGAGAIDSLAIAEQSCVRPMNTTVTDVGADFVSLTWDGDADENFLVRLYDDGSEDYTFHATNTNSITINGLTSSTHYYVWVFHTCDGGDTSYSAPRIEFTTTCVPYVAYDTLYEDFDSYTGVDYNVEGGVLPNCWEGYSNGTNAAYMPHITNGSTYSYSITGNPITMTSGSSATYGNTKIVRLPKFAEPVNTLTMSYWYCTESSTIGTLYVGYMTGFDYENDFVPIATHPASSASVHSGDGPQASGKGIYDTVSFDTVPANALFIAFKWFQDGTYYSVCIDNVQVTSSGNYCMAPTATVSGITYNQATLNINSSASSYVVNLKQATEASFNDANDQTITTNVYTFSNLQPQTTYQYRVKAICTGSDGVNTESNWIEGTFTTDSLPCFAPTDLTATEGYTSVTLDWTPGGVENQWEIHIWNSTVDTTVTATAHPVTVGGLQQNISYYAAVKSICAGGLEESEYGDTISFTTSQCETVTGVTASNVSAHQATISWTGTASSYVVDYGGLNHGQGTGTTVVVTGNSYTITGLLDDAQYSVFVRAICEPGVYGPWSTQVDFQTPEEGGDETYYTITANSATPSMGTVTGGGSYLEGSTITLTATPNQGYRFVQWQDGVTTNPRSVTVTADATYTAYFEAIPTYTITVQANDATMGTVTGSGVYEENSTVTISATPNQGYQFVQWSDGETAATRTITVTADATYTANFAPEGTELNYYDVTVSVNDPAMGSVQGGGTHIVEGSVITLTAVPNPGYRFVQWQDGNTDNPRQVTVTEDMSFTATFEALPEYTITVNVNDPTMGSVQGGGTYAEGTQVTLTAVPNQGYEFVQWQDGNAVNPRTITVTGDATYTATFRSSVGIADVESASLTIYPNPARESATIMLNGVSGEVTVTVVDMNGRTVGQYSTSSTDRLTLDLSGYARGAYFVRVSGEGVNMVKKLIVK